jgi:hypothetical protein
MMQRLPKTKIDQYQTVVLVMIAGIDLEMQAVEEELNLTEEGETPKEALLHLFIVAKDL